VTFKVAWTVWGHFPQLCCLRLSSIWSLWTPYYLHFQQAYMLIWKFLGLVCLQSFSVYSVVLVDWRFFFSSSFLKSMELFGDCRLIPLLVNLSCRDWQERLFRVCVVEKLPIASFPSYLTNPFHSLTYNIYFFLFLSNGQGIRYC
jgi:hypothetical protein